MHRIYFNCIIDLDNAKVDLEKVKEIESYFDKYPNSGFKGVKFELFDGNRLYNITLPEYPRIFQEGEIENFAQMLSKALISGTVELLFSYEKSIEQWGYRVTPNNFKFLSYAMLTDDEYRILTKIQDLTDEKIRREVNKFLKYFQLYEKIKYIAELDEKQREIESLKLEKDMADFIYQIIKKMIF